MVDWDEYEPIDLGVNRPLHEVTRAEARSAFERFLSVRQQRIEQLRTLARANGVDLDAPDGVQRLNDWFTSSVERNPTDPERMANRWYSVVTDIGAFIGECLIDRSDGVLRWELFTAGKKDVAYQRPVIMGFRNVPNPKYNIDPARVIATYGHRILLGEVVEPDFFCQLLTSASEDM